MLVPRFEFGYSSRLNIDYSQVLFERKKIGCEGATIPAMATPLSRRFVPVLTLTPGMLFSIAIF